MNIQNSLVCSVIRETPKGHHKLLGPPRCSLQIYFVELTGIIGNGVNDVGGGYTGHDLCMLRSHPNDDRC